MTVTTRNYPPEHALETGRSKSNTNLKIKSRTAGAYIITNMIAGVPYYKCSIVGPKTLF